MEISQSKRSVLGPRIAHHAESLDLPDTKRHAGPNLENEKTKICEVHPLVWSVAQSVLYVSAAKHNGMQRCLGGKVDG